MVGTFAHWKYGMEVTMEMAGQRANRIPRAISMRSQLLTSA